MIRARSRPAWVEIDADALAANSQLLKKLYSPAKLCAVVKADGYGHGAVLVSRILEENGVDQFAVSNVDEAVELRESGISSPIICLSEPSHDAIETALRWGVTLTLYSKSAVEKSAVIARKLYESMALPDPRPVYELKIDTGMHRVGADPKDIIELAEFGSERGLILGGFWTHMSVGDEPATEGQFDFTKEQIRVFEKAKGDLRSLGFSPRFHVANSATGFNYPQARYDMVRSGIALYGCSPSSHTKIPGLIPVMSLKARVSFLRRVGPGERPLYGRLRETLGNTVLATVPIGYADGVPRALFGAGAEVLIRGIRRPLAGMVTMDQIVVDCGDDSEIVLGDEVVLLGSQGSETITVDEWASLLGTINYEVITRIGFRVPRILETEVGATSGSVSESSR